LLRECCPRLVAGIMVSFSVSVSVLGMMGSLYLVDTHVHPLRF
jgi:hypothetical protein